MFGGTVLKSSSHLSLETSTAGGTSSTDTPRGTLSLPHTSHASAERPVTPPSPSDEPTPSKKRTRPLASPPLLRGLPETLLAQWRTRALDKTKAIPPLQHASSQAFAHNELQRHAIELRRALTEIYGTPEDCPLPQEVLDVFLGFKSFHVYVLPEDKVEQQTQLTDFFLLLEYLKAYDIRCLCGMHILENGRILFSNLYAYHQQTYRENFNPSDDAHYERLGSLQKELFKKAAEFSDVESLPKEAFSQPLLYPEGEASHARALLKAECAPSYQTWEGSIKQIALITHNRPEELNRCLNSYQQSFQTYGRSTPLYVFDDSNTASFQEENRRIIQRYREAGMDIHYVGPQQKEHLRQHMQTQLETLFPSYWSTWDCAAHLQTMFGHLDPATGTYTGGTHTQRNWVSFFFGMSHANRTLCIDDDTQSMRYTPSDESLKEYAQTLAAKGFTTSFNAETYRMLHDTEGTEEDKKVASGFFTEQFYLIADVSFDKKHLCLFTAQAKQQLLHSKSYPPSTTLHPQDLVGAFESYGTSLESAHFSGHLDLSPLDLIRSGFLTHEPERLPTEKTTYTDVFSGSTYATPAVHRIPLVTCGKRQQDFFLAVLYENLHPHQPKPVSVPVTHHHMRGSRNFTASWQLREETGIDLQYSLLTHTCEQKPGLMPALLRAGSAAETEALLDTEYTSSIEDVAPFTTLSEINPVAAECLKNIATLPKTTQDMVCADPLFNPSTPAEETASILRHMQHEAIEKNRTLLRHLKMMQLLGELPWEGYSATPMD